MNAPPRENYFVDGPQTGRVPPHNLDAERSLLGGILLERGEDRGKAFAEVAQVVRPEHFYRDAHRKVFEAMSTLAAGEEPIDRVTVKNELTTMGVFEAVGGDEFVDLLDKIVPTAANLAWYAGIIRDCAIRRRGIEMAQAIALLGYEHHGSGDDYLVELERRLTAFRDTAAPARALSRQITLDRAKKPPVEHFICGVLFPFGKASVLYGPQGAGKSAFLAQLVFKVAAGAGGSFLNMLMHDQEGGTVLVYSTEDTFEDWERKAGAILLGYPGIDVARALQRLHVIDKTEGVARLTELVQVRSETSGESVTRHQSRPTAERLALIREAKRLGARLIVIETASRLVEKEDNENFAALLAACGHIAAETGAAVILSHHPTKNAAKDNDSSLEGARGGGAFTNNSRTAVSLFPASAEEVARLTERDLHFAAKDVFVLEHQKGTSSVPRQEPVVLVRCGTPHGPVLKLPEEVASDPVQSAAHARRADQDRAAEEARFAVLYDLVAELRASGPVSPSKLRDNHRARLGGVAKNGQNGVEVFVGRAIQAGVLTVLRRDSLDRVLDLGLGTRPARTNPAFDPRATAGDPEHGRAE